MIKDSIVWPCVEVPDVDEFFASLRAAIESSQDWILHDQPEVHAIFARYTGSGFDGEDLRLCAFRCVSATAIVDFAPTAAAWGSVKSEDTVVTDTQVNQAYLLFAPVVQAAAKSMGLTLTVAMARKREFELPQQMRRLIDGFVALANLQVLHPCDWERFYQVVRHAHRYRIRMRPADLARELSQRRVPDETVAELVNYYEFGRSLLSGRFCWEDDQDRRSHSRVDPYTNPATD